MTQSLSNTQSPDYWAVLGLPAGADPVTLKRAFRAQARRWHPDLNGNDPVAEERFKLVNEAYAVLSDPHRRRIWEEGGGIGSGGQEADPYASGFPDFEDYLADLFGEQPRRRSPEPPPGPQAAEPEPQPRPQASGPVTAAPSPPPPVQAGTDLETTVDLSPEQALQGERVELELADGTLVEVRTPALAGDGWRLRLAGVTPGGGDHFLQLRVRTPEGLRIDGLRVLYQLELSPAQAALGCRLAVPTLAGPVRLSVPPCSSSGRLLRLRGRGLEWGDQRGDQLVEVRIVLPDQLSEAEAALYRRLDELAEDDESLA
ncbi:DnaJ C-terminal domain-containing protein [Synechococcus sp. GFB01]|uniref:DnaJ C-terminal domain-containing protein n=1 Tax=Synechococcus sp. GFB01 TaxID=1662190 RepID=UPI00064FD65C|nr:DnaJ C-terminal domain-containing protein [Synechococcus sp. GFB01]KMM16936.1 molecular chaperone DnaJ [Synechococcus sp. GFB01]